LLDVFATATTQEETRGYNDFRKLINDLGYKISRVPQSREELETILSGRSLPVQVQTQEVSGDATVGDSTDIIVSDSNDGTISIGYRSYTDPNKVGNGDRFDKGRCVYETAKNIRKKLTRLPLNTSELTRIYLQHAAQKRKHSMLANALVGRRSLEEVAKEKTPSSSDFSSGDLIFEVIDYDEKAHKSAKQRYNERREELEKILLGANRNNSKFWNDGTLLGAIIGGSASVLTAIPVLGDPLVIDSIPFLSWFSGHVALGVILSSNRYRYRSKRKLLKQAREMDGWIKQGRVSAGVGGLEKKAEDVSLTMEEKDDLSDLAGLTSILPGVGLMGLTSWLLTEPTNIFFLPFLSSWASGSAGYIGSYFGLKKYLTNRKLKQKRIAAGPERKISGVQGLREHEKIYIFLKSS